MDGAESLPIVQHEIDSEFQNKIIFSSEAPFYHYDFVKKHTVYELLRHLQKIIVWCSIWSGEIHVNDKWFQ